jgi:hypothetical protein
MEWEANKWVVFGQREGLAAVDVFTVLDAEDDNGL